MSELPHVTQNGIISIINLVACNLAISICWLSLAPSQKGDNTPASLLFLFQQEHALF
jgi:hypothetical protein